MCQRFGELLAITVCKHFKEEGLVCPPILRKSHFTVGAMDKIDHNASSTSAQDSFHGTGFSSPLVLKQDYARTWQMKPTHNLKCGKKP